MNAVGLEQLRVVIRQLPEEGRRRWWRNERGWGGGDWDVHCQRRQIVGDRCGAGISENHTAEVYQVHHTVRSGEKLHYLVRVAAGLVSTLGRCDQRRSRGQCGLGEVSTLFILPSSVVVEGRP